MTGRLSRDQWRPTKFACRNGRWESNRANGGLASRLVADLQVAAYQDAIEAQAFGDLVDLGCGNAPLAGIYRERVSSYTWADWGNSIHQLFELDMEVDLNALLPIADESFDTILLTDVLEHIAEPHRLFGELLRILRPGGVIILGTPFLFYIHEEPHDHFRFTEFHYRYMARQFGCEAVEVRVVGGAMDSLVDMSCKIAAAIWQPLAWLPYGLWKGMRVLPPLARLNARAGWRFPLAYVAVFRKA